VQEAGLGNVNEIPTVLSTVTDGEGLRELYPEWQELLYQRDKAPVFLTWEWISTWFSHFGNDCSLRIVVFRAADDRRALGIAPLAIYTRRLFGIVTLRELGFAGRNLAPDHMDLLLRNGHERTVTRAFFDWLRKTDREWDVLLLNGLSTNSQLASQLADDAGHPWHHRHEIVCPILALPDDPSTWFSSLPKKRRYKLRRSRQQLQAALGDQIRLRCIESDSELEQGLSTMIRLHRATRSARHTANAFPDRRFVDCHRQLSARFLRKGWLRLYLLQAGDRVIAAAYCFHHRKTVSFYSTGYDAGFSRFSPGIMLLAHIIEKSISEGALRFDYLRGDEPYKFIFARDSIRDLQIRLPSSPIGHLVTRLYDLGRERIRPVLRSMAPSRR
jgi:CelD/BcsL family acetyltransferase involved in cellulose biosynthesis